MLYIYIYIYMYIYILGVTQKFREEKVLKNLGVPNEAGVHRILHRVSWCDLPGWVWGQNPKSFNYLKVVRA